MEIHCVLCFRDESGEYYKNAFVTLVSIFENTREKIIVHILHDDTIHHGREALETLCQKYGHSIFFHHVPELPPHVAQKVSVTFNLGATYLYYLHEFITADKAIYLDCDVIVNMDIVELYSIPMEQHVFASTLDSIPYWRNGKVRKKYRKTVDFLQLSEGRYINSGLLLINVKKLRECMREENRFVQLTLAAVDRNIPLPYPDMDILNSIAHSIPHGVKIIDRRFNLWRGSLHLSIEELDNTIFHYIVEPDSNLFPAHLLFWKYYAKTPFSHDMFRRMSVAFSSEPMDFFQVYLRNPKHRNHAVSLLQYGFWRGLFHSIFRKIAPKKNRG